MHGSCRCCWRFPRACLVGAAVATGAALLLLGSRLGDAAPARAPAGTRVAERLARLAVGSKLGSAASAAIIGSAAVKKTKKSASDFDWIPWSEGPGPPEDLRGFGAAVWRALHEKGAHPVTAGEAARSLLRAAAASENATLSLVQVGACDGAWVGTNDPVQQLLSAPQMRALALEPVPYLWQELDQRLRALAADAGRRLLAVNAALCLESKENVPFYVASPRFAKEHPEAEHWAKRELGSFDRRHLRRHRIPERYIDTIRVPCLGPRDLLALPGSPVGPAPAGVDALVVDAEGLDADLVTALLAVEGFRPALVIFEQKHVLRPKLLELTARLRRLRYVHWQDADQMVAILAAPEALP